MEQSSVIFLNSVQVRWRANAQMRATGLVARQVREQLDRAVLLRAQTRQLVDTAIRFDELRREHETRSVRLTLEWGNIVDGALCEDAKLLARLDALGYECDRCREGKMVSAVVKFESMASALAICAECFGELSRLSLGQVT